MEQPFLDSFSSVKDQVWAEVRRAMQMRNHTDSFWDNLQGFLHAVDWREPWIRGVLAAHVTVLVLVLLFRQNVTVLTGVFALLGSIVYFGENINSIAGQHWQSFATQDYFDEHGVFYNALVSGPALFTLLVVLVFYLLQAASLMVEVKKKEIIHKARQQARADKQGKKQQ